MTHTFKSEDNHTEVIKDNLENELIDVTRLDTEKIIYNAVELMEMGTVEPSYLMEPIFPQKGTAVLAGKPDIGKSQFARQLCIQVALGLEEIIGFQIKAVHNRSIYVATEDNEDSTRASLNKQMNGLGKEAKENLRFMFAASMDQEDILKELDKALTDEPADLVIVDMNMNDLGICWGWVGCALGMKKEVWIVAKNIELIPFLYASDVIRFISWDDVFSELHPI